MSNRLYDVLEICLQEVENGTDMDTVLSRYPELAEDLRPILETAIHAKSLAAADPSPDILRRNRAKVLQQAAQMRQVQAHPSRRIWSVPLRRALVSLAVIATLFIGTHGLINASAKTLPGDNLYPVKRSWEDVRVLLTFDTKARTQLEVYHETERVDEVNNLFAEGRSASVDFAGTVTAQNGDLWRVAKIPVLISAQTDLGTQTIKVGDAIYVKGSTQADGTVLAEFIQLLPPNSPLPEVDDDHMQEIQSQDSGNPSVNQSGEGEDNSNDSSIIPTPQESETQSPGNEATQSSPLSGGSIDNSGSNDNHNKSSDSGSNSNHGGSDDSGGGGSDSGGGSDD